MAFCEPLALLHMVHDLVLAKNVYTLLRKCALHCADGAGNSMLHGTGENGTELCAEPVHR